MKENGQKAIIRKETGGSKDKFWNPRFWDGVTVSAFLKALRLAHGHVSFVRIPMAAVIMTIAPFNSFCGLCQKIFYGKKIRNQKLTSPPIFILGHWRSGTTLLHEYMIRDEQFTYPNTYTCFAPSHFLFTHKWLSPFVGLLMPKKRPMDNMAAGLSRPQEDEFAICVLGEPSPYLNILFPNEPAFFPEFLTLRNVSDADRKHWLDTFEYLVKAITVETPKTLVLKSPPHTGRIKVILERFPDAKFVYIHRNPYVLFPSTYNLWTKLSNTHGLQLPKGKNLVEKVLSNFEEMDAAYTADLPLLKPGQITEISYDQLVADPVATIEKIYQDINIDGFEENREKFEAFAKTQKNYKKNKFSIAPDIADMIADRWKPYLDRYGYTKPEE